MRVPHWQLPLCRTPGPLSFGHVERPEWGWDTLWRVAHYAPVYLAYVPYLLCAQHLYCCIFGCILADLRVERNSPYVMCSFFSLFQFETQ